MPEQYTITGTITPANGAERAGVRVQAFDRDLPSLERRTGTELQMLGTEATTDAEGRFQITYTLEQFQNGEGISTFRKSREKNADLSFRVFDRTGQELKIRNINIDALKRTLGPDQIIFNAPTPVEVSILVDAPQEAGDSEYELLIALIAPVVEDLPLIELSDEDVVFLSNELGLEQQRDVQQHIEWLRRCALLAQETNLPIEAFYGWGRTNVPDALTVLATVALKNLPSVLKELISFRDEKLRDALLAAIEENIIPVGFRARVDEIVRLLKRRDQVLHVVIAQLLDEDTKAVLAGYTVTTFDQDAMGENRGLDTTDDEGQFSFAFYAPKEMPPNAPPREFRLEVQPPQGEKLPEDGHVSVNLNKPETEIFPALIKVPKPEISKQQEQLKSVLLDIPPELRTFLGETQHIHTLADIRRKGGLSHLADLPAAADPVLIRQLESLADLDRISPDISVSKTLLSHNFDSVLAISDTPQSEFVGTLSEGEAALSELDAAKLHVMARAQTHLLDNTLMRMAADNANGFKLPAANGAAPAADVFQQPCGCADCEAAVSPAAYLAALLDYTLKHIRNNKNKIDLQFLVDTFHQPFIDLPTDCEAVEQQLRQVRICIEVLRSYLGNRPLADPVKEEALATAEGDYSFAVYAMLLNRIGTSYEEIRRIRAETAENRQALAERLGIDLTEPRSADELEQLFLDPSAKPPQDHLLTEQAVEQLFGVGDTTRDPLSEGAKLGDDQAQITRWNLHGVVWGQNTDQEGRVYVTLVNPAPTVFRVKLHQDRLRTTLIASGEIATAQGTVKLVQESNSRLSGVFEIAYTVGSTGISIAAIPAFLSWQLKHLRTLWSRQDHPIDAYSDDASPRLPIIDPDLLGPDDFRNPTPTNNPAGPDKAFDIWLKRRQFVDNTLSSLQAARETKGITEILKQVLGDPLPDVDGLLLTLTKSGAAAGEITVAKESITALHLSVESFTRLMSIRAKEQLAQSDPRNDKVSEQEWREVYSILTQALKAKRFDAWRTAEQDAGTTMGLEELMGLEEFWLSVTDPKEGDWPPIPVADQPLIDPDIVKLTDLPEWLAGKEAISLWKVRKAALLTISNDLKHERETKDFDAVLQSVFGFPLPDLDGLKNNLSNSDEKIRTSATHQIETDLHLTVESFKRLMAIKASNDQLVAAKKPTAAEWAEVYAMLTPVRKVKHEYPAWVLQETSAGLVYWKALKAKLPRWRASLESRQAWQQALRARTQQPIIDPTVMGADDLQHVIPGDPAFDVWKKRYDRLTVLHDALKTAREADDPDTLAGLDHIIQDTLGFASADLEVLDQERQAGHSIEKRLEQLNLVNSAFNYLMRIRGLAEATQPITDSEWETVYATLTQVRIQRESAQLRAEEQDKSIILSPDLFKIPQALLTPLPFLASFTPRWLSTWQARRDWQDMLQSRIDQEGSIGEGLRSAISAVEEAALPVLRDALIAASDAVGANLSEQAEWITARLLIDARFGGCGITTRVAQALETLQTLIFDLRTGQLKQLPPSPLSLVSDDFDDEWKWIGSYATWRSAMFVFLYPENILQPSLLKDKTPAFEKLIKHTRGSRLDPENACREAESYAEYFHDICTLEIEATCQASTVAHTGEGCNKQNYTVESMFYMFGRAASGKIYWSAWSAFSEYGQASWKKIEEFSDTTVVRIVGAMPYRKTVTDANNPNKLKIPTVRHISSYIHLFCITEVAGTKSLRLARLNLDNFGQWSTDKPVFLDLPPLLSFNSRLEIVPVQSQSDVRRPGLVFHTTDSNMFFFRALDEDGTSWEPSATGWEAFRNFIDRTLKEGLGWKTIQAVLQVNKDFWFVLKSLIGSYSARMIAVNGGGQWALDQGGTDNIGEHIVGVIPGREGPLAASSALYVFSRAQGSTTTEYLHITSTAGSHPFQSALADVNLIPPNSGSGAPGQQVITYRRERNAQAFYMYRYAESGDSLIGSATIRAVPRI